ncbi:hypothetical protein C8R48DRAFT_677563 [Suillus tomentosus]|nr:hypothetical protein C8R48DRAFT_677563 [Suillus tomentosus]
MEKSSLSACITLHHTYFEIDEHVINSSGLEVFQKTYTLSRFVCEGVRIVGSSWSAAESVLRRRIPAMRENVEQQNVLYYRQQQSSCETTTCCQLETCQVVSVHERCFPLPENHMQKGLVFCQVDFRWKLKHFFLEAACSREGKSNSTEYTIGIKDVKAEKHGYMIVKKTCKCDRHPCLHPYLDRGVLELIVTSIGNQAPHLLKAQLVDQHDRNALERTFQLAELQGICVEVQHTESFYIRTARAVV